MSSPGGGAPPQLSPDGRWWWTGTEWVPAVQQPAAQPPPPQEGFAPVAPTPPEPAWQQQATPPGYGYAPAYAYPPPGPPSSNDALAITSLVAGVLWFGGLASLVAVVTGHLSRSRARREGKDPSGLAVAGLVLGYLGIVGTALLIAVIAAATAGFQSMDDRLPRRDLQQAADVEYAYHGEYGTFTDTAGLESQGFFPGPGVTLIVLARSETSFCLTASRYGHRAWYWDSTAAHPHASTIPC